MDELKGIALDTDTPAWQVESAFNQLVFYGAGVSEPRGVKDSGLTDLELQLIVDRLRGIDKYRNTRDWIIDYLTGD